jgi:hypothetical protein
LGLELSESDKLVLITIDQLDNLNKSVCFPTLAWFRDYEIESALVAQSHDPDCCPRVQGTDPWPNASTTLGSALENLSDLELIECRIQSISLDLERFRNLELSQSLRLYVKSESRMAPVNIKGESKTKSDAPLLIDVTVHVARWAVMEFDDDDGKADQIWRFVQDDRPIYECCHHCDTQAEMEKHPYLFHDEVLIHVTPAGRAKARQLTNGGVDGDSKCDGTLTFDSPQHKETWVSGNMIIEKGYVSNKGQLSKLARRHPEVRRDATQFDRRTLGNDRLRYVYDVRMCYELTEGSAGR